MYNFTMFLKYFYNSFLFKNIINNHKTLPASFYDKEYLLSEHLEGFDEFKKNQLSFVKQKQLQLLDLKKGIKLLEVGYGRGELLLHCCEKGIKAYGVDYSKDAYNIAKKLLKKYPNAEVKVADARDLPYKDNTFDRI